MDLDILTYGRVESLANKNIIHVYSFRKTYLSLPFVIWLLTLVPSLA